MRKLENSAGMKTKVKSIQKQDIPAGNFLSWLHHTREAQITGEGTSVPCSECRACCTSSYFIHIKPEERQTLARIPEELLFSAPGLPEGNMVLGYDKNGHCPMFINNECSIYEDRPQTCRDYDCRVFPATALSPGKDKPLISQRATRWTFDFPSPQDQRHMAAVQAAAQFLKKHVEDFSSEFVPKNPTQQAVLAIRVYPVFLNFSDTSEKTNPEDKNPKIVQAVLDAYIEFLI